MHLNLLGRSARVTRRQVLRSIGVVGAAGAISVGCAPRLLGPAAFPALSQPVPPAPPTSREAEFLASKAFKDSADDLAGAPVEVLPTSTPILVPTETPLPTASPTPLPTSTPVPPTATPTPRPSPTATPLTYDEARLKDAVAHARVSYAGSSDSLATNIEVATRRLDGAVIPPGGVFSFLDRLGPQTLEAGFRMGYGIIVQNGQAKTVPMIAGGICDVSTLLFQAVYRAGLPIVTRYSHSYWIEHYAAPPDGMVGLEATVDVQPVDFRFCNGTKDFLKLVATTRGGWIDLKLMGVNPGWTVTIAPPIIRNVVKTDRAVIRQVDPGLPPGAEVWIETAQDGFDVTLSRRVTRGTQTLDTYTYTAHYLPSHNVVDVGALPTATPTASPSPTPTKSPTPAAKSPTPTTKSPAPAASSTPSKATTVSTPTKPSAPAATATPAKASPPAASPTPKMPASPSATATPAKTATPSASSTPAKATTPSASPTRKASALTATTTPAKSSTPAASPTRRKG